MTTVPGEGPDVAAPLHPREKIANVQLRGKERDVIGLIFIIYT